MKIPKNIQEQGDNPQWSGEIDGKKTVIYYDDDISGVAPQNMYAVFTEAGFHGWLMLGFTMSEIHQIVKREPLDYDKEYEDYSEEE